MPRLAADWVLIAMKCIPALAAAKRWAGMYAALWVTTAAKKFSLMSVCA